MRLIAHSAIEGDLGKRLAGLQHEELRAMHAVSHDVRKRRLAEGFAESPREVTGAE
jgi:hypothetical protein